MTQKERTWFRTVTLASFFILVLYMLGFFRDSSTPGSLGTLPFRQGTDALGSGEKINLHRSLFLTQQQCLDAFPNLNKEIDERVENGPFELSRDDSYMGLIQGRIKDGKIYIITASNDVAREKHEYRNAALQQLHRAIITSPEPIPDTIFALCVNDFPRNNTWSFSKWNVPTLNDWLMPHFSFWSWPQSFIGTLDDVLGKIDKLERGTDDSNGMLRWGDKISKAVWRGTSWFNPIGNKNLRASLLKVTEGKDWADAEALKWEGGNGRKALNALPIEEFCKYKYIIYTEGVTYSGRLHYHQACTSIIITPPPTFLVHTTHLMKPVFSSSLPLSQPLSPYRLDHASINRTWPLDYRPNEANVVFVAPDWSDLEATIRWLESNKDIAEGIARRSRSEMVDGGYLSSAAEVCYWRALVRGWNKVVKVNESDWKEEGVRWESFSLRGKVSWD